MYYYFLLFVCSLEMNNDKLFIYDFVFCYDPYYISLNNLLMTCTYNILIPIFNDIV